MTFTTAFQVNPMTTKSLPRLHPAVALATATTLALAATLAFGQVRQVQQGNVLDASPQVGSGGSNNASHLKAHFTMTLADLSPGMLDLSRKLNPDCEHIQGDMKTLRLGRTFDAVFIHDAIMYMTNEADLRLALETAFIHSKPGGAMLVMPDVIRETFVSLTTHGGHDGERRSIRYIEWTFDDDSADTTYTVDFAYLLREEGKPVRAIHDRHVFGIFPRETWLRLLREVGFEPRAVPDPWDREVFIGRKA